MGVRGKPFSECYEGSRLAFRRRFVFLHTEAAGKDAEHVRRLEEGGTVVPARAVGEGDVEKNLLYWSESDYSLLNVET
jgi:hypothetical protein